MQNIALIRLQMNHLVTQARQDIHSLSVMDDSSDNSQTLQRLWDTVSSMHFLSEMLANQAMMAGYYFSTVPAPALPAQPGTAAQPGVPPVTPLPNQTLPPPGDLTLTLQELENYDGKNGRPAYVAVGGVVYDVTNNRAWAAATHFGLVAGKDYTAEFASCHAGQEAILATLPIVGRLA
ncbi:cytochrome b5 domain-containing protein [Salipaludibacillus aurantiacus]|uniref:Predicted heme/steroid binding protein n=1 Tax=Salipaludibacillus aurantiacus TaxID=1601833 RepID=A0A1H9SAG0_9BACI|nr:cytochrome b5 domain-containing protein [Salipaludibacillus aurantiacus]SER81908.1 Predicted heme/steroid binding protein [Salipaludibacillus aurantiacus]